MNFYSEDIINHIIDTEDIENIVDEIETFYENVFMTFCYYSNTIVNPLYIRSLLENKKNKIIFRCIDTYFNIDNCPSLMIYNKHVKRQEVVYYIFMICTKPKFKKLGYASNLLTDFIQKLKNKKEEDNKEYKIILSSIESAVTFYESYGFRWTRKSITDYPILMQTEKYDENHEYFIMEMVL